jgi:two-component system LytT family response regulator
VTADAVRVLIVDDEPPARAILREYLAQRPDVRILGECANGFEAVKVCAEDRPDVVFLDVEMPKLNGFETLELLDSAIAPVFVTAYDRYAVKAFEVHAVDYVLKPFTRERLYEALERARARRRTGPLDAPALSAAAREQDKYLDRIVVRDGTRVHILAADKLDYAEAQDDYVALKSEGKTYLKTQTLSSLAASLDPRRFLRVHRSYVLNLDRLARLELYAKNSHVAILRDGGKIPISRDGHARLREILGE